MITQNTTLDHDESSDEEEISKPKMEIVTNKSLKSLRTVPLLHITAIPAWIDDQNN